MNDDLPPGVKRRFPEQITFWFPLQVCPANWKPGQKTMTVDAESIVLTWNGTPLDHQSSLRDAGVTAGCTIRVTSRLRGAAPKVNPADVAGTPARQLTVPQIRAKMADWVVGTRYMITYENGGFIKTSMGTVLALDTQSSREAGTIATVAYER